MDWLNLDEEDQESGAFILSYGETGKGQTVSTLISAPKKTLVVYTEPGDIRRTCRGNVNLKEKIGDEYAIKIGSPKSFKDLKLFIAQEAEVIAGRYKTFVLDTVDFFMNVQLLGDIKKETSDAGIFKSQRDLVNEYRTDEQGYAGLAAQMIEFCKICKELTRRGMIVIFLAHEAENPKWNMALKLAPSFAGRAFGKDFRGFFDLIGYVESRYDENGIKIFPPLISFDEGNKRGFLAKWKGPTLDSYDMPLDWTEILKRGGEINGKRTR